VKTRDWIFLYLPPLFLLLLGNFRFFVIPGAVLLVAITTHLYLLRIERERARLRREFRRH
jgi:hypothetical protein